MRLDPRKVRFVAPFFHVGMFGGAVRFVGRENTVHLQETALVAEGNLLKVGLLGLELLFRRALAEWSAVTVPYSRITAVRYVRFPPLRLIALAVLAVCVVVPAVVALFNPIGGLAVALGALGPALLAVYVAVRVSARYVIRFRARDGRSTKLMFRITSARLRAEFDRRLRENREAAARYADPDGTAHGPDPIVGPRRAAWPWVALLAAVFAVTAVALTIGFVVLLAPLAGGPGGGPFGGPPGAPGDAFAGAFPGAGPAGTAVVPDITPETVATGLVGRDFTFQAGPGKGTKRWTVEPGEVREVVIVGSEPDAGGQIRRVDVRVTLEGGGQRLRGVLRLLYLRATGGWSLAVVSSNDADGKGRPFEFTDLK
jgi:hypothetical protein